VRGRGGDCEFSAGAVQKWAANLPKGEKRGKRERGRLNFRGKTGTNSKLQQSKKYSGLSIKDPATKNVLQAPVKTWKKGETRKRGEKEQPTTEVLKKSNPLKK